MQVDRKARWLYLLVLVAGGAAPIFLLLLASGIPTWGKGLTKMPQIVMYMHQFANWYVPLVLGPALAILLIVALYSRRRYRWLYERIVIGLGAGAIATVALDFFRELGVIHGWLPTDTSILFGKMIAGPTASLTAILVTGFIYHFLNGANFGIFYTLVVGKARWYWAIVWGLVVELGMMTLPPMGPLAGPFGSKTGRPALFLITLVAHIAFGLVLGLLTQHWLRYRGSIIKVLSPATGELEADLGHSPQDSSRHVGDVQHA